MQVARATVSSYTPMQAGLGCSRVRPALGRALPRRSAWGQRTAEGSGHLQRSQAAGSSEPALRSLQTPVLPGV